MASAIFDGVVSGPSGEASRGIEKKKDMLARKGVHEKKVLAKLPRTANSATDCCTKCKRKH